MKKPVALQDASGSFQVSQKLLFRHPKFGLFGPVHFAPPQRSTPKLAAQAQLESSTRLPFA